MGQGTGRVPRIVAERAWCAGYGRLLSVETDRVDRLGAALVLGAQPLILVPFGIAALLQGRPGPGLPATVGPLLLTLLIAWFHRAGGPVPVIYCYERGAVLYRRRRAVPYAWSQLGHRERRRTVREEHVDTEKVRTQVCTQDGTELMELRDRRPVLAEHTARLR
ncbi:hypothetical protein ACFVGM_04915 [Kitasatospora purpeofusca]|uniref:hypothetical protein n=1 Tax=Kitasatospora purpeofusca TaxID=67352 RepID=UPI00369FBC8A